MFCCSAFALSQRTIGALTLGAYYAFSTTLSDYGLSNHNNNGVQQQSCQHRKANTNATAILLLYPTTTTTIGPIGKRSDAIYSSNNNSETVNGQNAICKQCKSNGKSKKHVHVQCLPLSLLRVGCGGHMYVARQRRQWHEYVYVW